jgi:enoyl-CoA hydratase
MSFDNLLVADHDAVRRITVNRPDKLNALDRHTIEELHEAFAAAGEAAGTRAVLLTGGGAKAFVAGADIAEMSGMTPLQARDFSRRGQALMTRIERLGKPVVAAINGFALGGGLELALACHVRVAADTAKVGQPEVNLGLIPGFGGTQRLVRLCGRGAALDLCLTGQNIDAARALQLGIVSRVVAAADLEAAAIALATQLANAAPQAIRGVLDSILLGAEAPIDVGLDYETQAFAVAFSTDDMREGTSAFLARRKPQFVGT